MARKKWQGRWGCRVSGTNSGAVRSSGEKGGEEQARLAFVLVWELEREYAQQKKSRAVISLEILVRAQGFTGKGE